MGNWHPHTLAELVCEHLRDASVQVVDIREPELDVRREALAIAKRLAAAGAEPGAHVLVEAAQTGRAVSVILAAWSLGLAIAPIDPATSEETRALLARECGARFHVDVGGQIHRCPDVARPTRLAVRLRSPRVVTGVDLALSVFTSGTSSFAKCVRLTHSNVLAALAAISNYLRLRREDRILCIPPLYFDYGLYQVLLALFNGCTVLLSSAASDPLSALRAIRDHGVSVLPLVPASASSLARLMTIASQRPATVRLVTNTGGHLTRRSIDDLRRAFPDAELIPMYGLTESKRALFLPPELVDAKPESVGGPMPGMDARIFIEQATADGVELREVEPGQHGELYVRGASVMQGYASASSAGGARLVQGDYRDDTWLATGDIFERDADGHLYFRGRRKDLIKQSGFCVYPRDLEAVVEAMPLIGGAVALGTQLPSGDEAAVLFVQYDGPDRQAMREDIVGCLIERFGKSAIPRHIRFVDQWPETRNGKIDRTRLAEWAQETR